MSKLVDIMRTEPTRVWMYGFISAVVAALAFFGVISGGSVPVIMAVVVAALALPSPVEALRAKVTPTSATELNEVPSVMEDLKTIEERYGAADAALIFPFDENTRREELSDVNKALYDTGAYNTVQQSDIPPSDD